MPTKEQKKNSIIAKIKGNHRRTAAVEKESRMLFAKLSNGCRHRRAMQGPGFGLEYEYPGCSNMDHLHYGGSVVSCGYNDCPLLK